MSTILLIILILLLIERYLRGRIAGAGLLSRADSVLILLILIILRWSVQSNSAKIGLEAR